MGRFIALTGKEDEESYVTTPVADVPEFKVTVRPSSNKRWAKIAKKKGLKPQDQDFVSLFDTSEESCQEALIEWTGTQHIWPEDGPDGLPVTSENMKRMATRMCGSVVEGFDETSGAKTWKSFWQESQSQVVEQRAVETKN